MNLGGLVFAGLKVTDLEFRRLGILGGFGSHLGSSSTYKQFHDKRYADFGTKLYFINDS